MIQDLLDPANVKELRRMVADAERIVLTCHVRPDGDAMGCTLALARLLTAMGKRARVVTPDLPLPQLPAGHL